MKLCFLISKDFDVFVEIIKNWFFNGDFRIYEKTELLMTKPDTIINMKVLDNIKTNIFRCEVLS